MEDCQNVSRLEVAKDVGGLSRNQHQVDRTIWFGAAARCRAAARRFGAAARCHAAARWFGATTRCRAAARRFSGAAHGRRRSEWAAGRGPPMLLGGGGMGGGEVFLWTPY